MAPLRSLFLAGQYLEKYVVIFQQITIGSNGLQDSARKGSPTLGDKMYIGAGAKIIGKVHIGSNVRIGAGAVITKDVPDNSTVVGVNSIKTHDFTPDTTYRTRHGDVFCSFQNGKFVKVI